MLGQATLKVMTFNIRYNNPGDGDNAWPRRLELVEPLLRFHSPDIIGVQEALPDQMEDLQRMLPDYASEGIARTDGGEFSAIWYRRSRLTKLAGSTFYLSPTPASLSTGWDAALPRIVTWAKFMDNASGHSFYCFNTHFDHIGEMARENSARLILHAIDSLNTEKLPVVLTGDFNAPPESAPIQTLLAGNMLDSRDVSLFPAHGPDATWSGWTMAGEPGRRIDFVFVRGDLAVYRHATLAESFSGRFPSDHLPVMAEVELYPPAATPRLHAHNDYEQERPLFDALAHGAASIEADVWLIDGQLRVSHLRPLKPEQAPTLTELYLQPMAEWVNAHGGRVYPGSDQPLQLMIDIKQDGEATFLALENAFANYRWLPVSIVLSGDRPIDLIAAQPAPFLQLDGRPDDLEKKELEAFMPMVSLPYSAVLSWKGKGQPDEQETEALRQLAKKVHQQGATLRLWGVPQDEDVWSFILNVGVDWVNADDLKRAKGFLKKQ